MLGGEEVSLLSVVSGDQICRSRRLKTKRIYDGDRGPNTGGMGAYSPVPAMDDSFARLVDEVVRPTVAELVNGVSTTAVCSRGSC